MIELQQFLLWVLRKIMVWPKKILVLPKMMVNILADGFEGDIHWVPMLMFYTLVAFILSLLPGIVVMLIHAGHPPALLAGKTMMTFFVICMAFVIAGGVTALYRAFKRDQQRIIDALTIDN